MSPKTAAKDRVPAVEKVAYSLGTLTNNLLSGAFGSMAIVLNLGLGMNPAVIGSIMGFSRITDAFLDPVMGYITDHTQSRWGRRRPYIVIGAILSGIIFALMWQLPAGHSESFYFWFFLIGTNLFYLAFTIYAAPLIGLGYELTADYFERVRLQGFSNLIGQIPWLMLSWSYAFMENKRWFSSNVEGARTLAIIIGAVVIILGVLPGIFCKERLYNVARETDQKSLKEHASNFGKGLAVTLRNKRFLMLAAATFFVFNGFTLISGLGPYVIIFYVFKGDQVLGASFVGMFGTILSICTFASIFVTTRLATRIGKKSAFILSTCLSVTGYILKWFCYDPNNPYLIFLPAPLIAFGLGGLFTTVSAMIADVCDLDELENGKRREGTFGAVYWWMVKLGTAMALVLSGHLLNMTGFLQSLGHNQSEHTLFLMRAYEVGVPALTYLLAIAVIAAYDLTPQRAHAIRIELEKRRGQTATA